MPLPTPPHKWTDQELEQGGLDPQKQRERQHRQNQKRLESIEDSQAALKASVDNLQNARRIDKAILIATIAGVLVGLVAIAVAVILSR